MFVFVTRLSLFWKFNELSLFEFDVFVLESSTAILNDNESSRTSVLPPVAINPESFTILLSVALVVELLALLLLLPPLYSRTRPHASTGRNSCAAGAM